MSYEANKAWRKRHPKKWQDWKLKYYSKLNFGIGEKRWTKAENDIILTSNILDRYLAKKLGRSVQAIQVQRSKIKNGQAIAI